ncbi:MAG: phage major capsid protein [Alphaproteobacteria bacterium]|nr:phage major capsid protein [Alphaproteobacteria bacterium]
MAKFLDELRNQRKELTDEMTKIGNKTDFGAADQARSVELNDKVELIDLQIDAIARALEQENKQAEYVNVLADDKRQSTDKIYNDLARHHEVFSNVLRFGVENLSDDDREFIKQLKIDNDMLRPDEATKGGYLVPTTFGTKLIDNIQSNGGIRKYATAYTSGDGREQTETTFDDESNVGELLGIDDTVAGGDIPTIGQIKVKSFVFSSKIVPLHNTVIQDSAHDIVAKVTGALSRRIWKLENQLFVSGTGIDQPKGIVTSATTDGTTTALPSAIKPDELIDLEHALDPSIREGDGIAWSFNDKTLKLLKKLKDSDGNFFWKRGLSDTEPATILGYPYHINQSMDDATAGKFPIIFGKLGNYRIRDVIGGNLQRFTDSRYAEKNQTGFLTLKRGDGFLEDYQGQTVKKLQMAP